MIIKLRDSHGKLRYQVRVNNRPGGTYDTLKDARKAEANLRLAKSRAQPITVAQLVARYMALWEDGELGRKPKTSTLTRCRGQARHLSEFFAGRSADSLKPVDAEEFRKLHRSACSTAAAIFDYAIKREFVSANHFAEHRPKKGPGRSKLAPLTDLEIDTLHEIVSGLYGARLGALIPFLAYTGLRPHECWALDWSDIDFETDEVAVADDSKTGARPALMLPKARAAIESFRGIGPVFVTPLTGVRLTNSNLGETYLPEIRKAFREAGTPRSQNPRRFTLYELRHFCAHLLYARMGVEVSVVATALGTSPSLIESTYGHYKVGALDRLREAVKRGMPAETRRPLADEEAESA